MPDRQGSVFTDMRVKNLIIAALGVFIAFLAAATIAELKGLQFIGSGVTASNTISVSGEGDVFAVPDTATFTVSILETAKDVKTAQDSATTKANAVIAYLKGAGVDQKDIQTTDYSVNPQYEYSQASCPVSSSGTVVYCPPGKQTLTGYQVSQTLTVKVRDTNKAGELLAGVGSNGASQVSGLSFTIDDQDALEAQARGKAIDDAKAKADALAKQLGVRIVRVVGFSENGNYPVPYYAKTMAAGASLDSQAAVPELPVGQNKITSNVSVTYEIQ
ncbi:MAG TPA: SIMPL domain-containing protein [Candidatus Paceibacterota bacterium]|nr:SIMPL domain-containing protein [Candidatus Paceibacterota bacterium]